jgi:hypothetical protein
LWVALISGPVDSFAHEIPSPTRRVELAPPPLPALLAQLPTEDRGLRWELANIALEVLLDAYRETLLASTEETPRSNKARTKLWRWQHATRSLIEEIEGHRQRLLVGPAFSVFADPRGQVFVTVDGFPLAVTGLGRNDDSVVQADIVERYCAYNHCPDEAAPAIPADDRLPVGGWQIQQGRPPVFNVGQRLQCRYRDLTQRARKALACREIAREIARLDRTLTAVTDKGETIDWQLLAASRRQSSDGTRLILNRSGAFITVGLPYLARLDEDVWVRVVDGLSMQGGTDTAALAIDGEQLRLH